MRIADPQKSVQALAPGVTDFLSGEIRMVIEGERVAAESSRTFPIFDPSKGAEIANAPRGGAADIDKAVKAARAALEGGWSRLLPVERQRLI